MPVRTCHLELARRFARGFTNLANYRLRMFLIGGAFTHPELGYPHRKLGEPD